MKTNSNLTWHITKKDLRQSAPALAAWLGLVLASAFVVRCIEMPLEMAMGGDVENWLNGMRTLLSCLIGSREILGVLLVAQLVQEDSLVGTEASWLTRPIGRGRLLRAKLLGAAVLVVLAPVVVLMPIWLTSRFSARELTGTVMTFALWQGVMTVLAGSVAAMTRDLGKFFFGVVVLALLMAMRVIFSTNQTLVADVIESRQVILTVIAAGVVVAAGGIQFLSGRTRWAWTMMVGGLIAACVVSVVWPWGTFAGLPLMRSVWPTDQAATQSLHVEKIELPADAKAAKIIFLQTGPLGAADEFLMPWSGSAKLSGPGPMAMDAAIEPGRHWGELAARQMLGLGPKAGSMTTAMELRLIQPADGGEANITGLVGGEVRLAQVKARVLGEWPWRPSVVGWSGSSFMRMVHLEQRRGEPTGEVKIEERDAVVPSRLQPFWSQSRSDGAMRRDCFYLLNRRLGIFRTMRVVENGIMQSNGLLVAERTLVYDQLTGVSADWARDTVMVKVRFEVIERWTKSFNGESAEEVKGGNNL